MKFCASISCASLTQQPTTMLPLRNSKEARQCSPLGPQSGCDKSKVLPISKIYAILRKRYGSKARIFVGKDILSYKELCVYRCLVQYQKDGRPVPLVVYVDAISGKIVSEESGIRY